MRKIIQKLLCCTTALAIVLSGGMQLTSSIASVNNVRASEKFAETTEVTEVMIDPTYQMIAFGEESSMKLMSDGQVHGTIVPTPGFGGRANLNGLGDDSRYDITKGVTIEIHNFELQESATFTIAMQTVNTGTIGGGNGGGVHVAFRIMKEGDHYAFALIVWNNSTTVTWAPTDIGALPSGVNTWKAETIKIAFTNSSVTIEWKNATTADYKNTLSDSIPGFENLFVDLKDDVNVSHSTKPYLSFSCYHFGQKPGIVNFDLASVNGVTPLDEYKTKLDAKIQSFVSAVDSIANEQDEVNIENAVNQNVFVESQAYDILLKNFGTQEQKNKVQTAGNKLKLLKGDIDARCESVTISTAGNIALNFYFNLTHSAITRNGHFTISVKDKTYYLELANATFINDNGLYKVTAKVPAKDYDEKITVSYDSENNSGFKYTYSVKEYCDAILKDTSGNYENEKPLVTALVRYCDYAKAFFNKTELVADDTINGVSKEMLIDYVATKAGTHTEGTDIGYVSIVLESETSIRIYFKTNNESIDCLVNNKKVNPVVKNNVNYVAVTNISAKDLDTDYTIKIGTEEITICVMDYVNSVVNKSQDNGLVNVAKALYLYNSQANTYSTISSEIVEANKKIINAISDPGFNKGFNIMGLDSSVDGAIPKSKIPFNSGEINWNIAQWNSKNDLNKAKPIVNLDTMKVEDGSKKVELDRINNNLTLELNASKEYSRMETSRSKWAHLLIEQIFDDKFTNHRLTDFDSLNVSLDFNVSKVEKSPKETNTNSKTLPAQFMQYFYIVNKNPNSEGYGSFMWFGLGFLDTRYEVLETSYLQDFAGGNAGNYIYCLGADASIGNKPFQVGKDYKVNVDILPYINDALSKAMENGFMKNTKLSDCVVTGMNLGWEVVGIWDVSVTFSNIALTAKIK